MAAAAAERRNRGAGDKERKKNRSGADMGIESFDPVKHVSKEKADTVSMWLVLTFATTMALVMRYVAVPGSQGNADLLWFMPMMAIFLLPSLHRSLLPEKFVEHYTRGTWFKASFLHVFTWLALTFLLTNAPFADIAAPQVDDGWGMISSSDDGFDFSDESKDKGVPHRRLHWNALPCPVLQRQLRCKRVRVFHHFQRRSYANNSWAVLS